MGLIKDRTHRPFKRRAPIKNGKQDAHECVVIGFRSKGHIERSLAQKGASHSLSQLDGITSRVSIVEFANHLAGAMTRLPGD